MNEFFIYDLNNYFYKVIIKLKHIESLDSPAYPEFTSFKIDLSY